MLAYVLRFNYFCYINPREMCPRVNMSDQLYASVYHGQKTSSSVISGHSLYCGLQTWQSASGLPGFPKA
uniref:Uncharacterized protein n=1 Tax=Arion vulgaris TaxID=1028688 RepID=A0A0B7AVS0_9EUPU